MEPGICTKMLKKLSDKLGAKFPATIPGCSLVKIAHLDCASLEVFSFTARKPSRRSITAAKRNEKEKKERGKNKNSKIEKPTEDEGHLLVQKSQIFNLFPATPEPKCLTLFHVQNKAKFNST